MNLIQEIEVEDKFGQEVCFQLWNNPADTGIFECPETWILTCRINGEEVAWEHWNNYDAAIFDNLDDAVSSLQGHVKLVGGEANE